MLGGVSVQAEVSSQAYVKYLKDRAGLVDLSIIAEKILYSSEDHDKKFSFIYDDSYSDDESDGGSLVYSEYRDQEKSEDAARKKRAEIYLVKYVARDAKNLTQSFWPWLLKIEERIKKSEPDDFNTFFNVISAEQKVEKESLKGALDKMTFEDVRKTYQDWHSKGFSEEEEAAPSSSSSSAAAASASAAAAAPSKADLDSGIPRFSLAGSFAMREQIITNIRMNGPYFINLKNRRRQYARDTSRDNFSEVVKLFYPSANGTFNPGENGNDNLGRFINFLIKKDKDLAFDVLASLYTLTYKFYFNPDHLAIDEKKPNYDQIFKEIFGEREKDPLAEEAKKNTHYKKAIKKAIIAIKQSVQDELNGTSTQNLGDTLNVVGTYPIYFSNNDAEFANSCDRIGYKVTKAWQDFNEKKEAAEKQIKEAEKRIKDPETPVKKAKKNLIKARKNFEKILGNPKSKTVKNNQLAFFTDRSHRRSNTAFYITTKENPQPISKRNPISNGSALTWTYNEGEGFEAGGTFADCVETAIRQLIGLVLWNETEQEFDLTALGDSAPRLTELFSKTNKQNKNFLNDGSHKVRSAVSKILSNLNKPIYAGEKRITESPAATAAPASAAASGAGGDVTDTDTRRLIEYIGHSAEGSLASDAFAENELMTGIHNTLLILQRLTGRDETDYIPPYDTKAKTMGKQELEKLRRAFGKAFSSLFNDISHSYKFSVNIYNFALIPVNIKNRQHSDFSGKLVIKAYHIKEDKGVELDLDLDLDPRFDLEFDVWPFHAQVSRFNSPYISVQEEEKKFIDKKDDMFPKARELINLHRYLKFLYRIGDPFTLIYSDRSDVYDNLGAKEFFKVMLTVPMGGEADIVKMIVRKSIQRNRYTLYSTEYVWQIKFLEYMQELDTELGSEYAKNIFSTLFPNVIVSAETPNAIKLLGLKEANGLEKILLINGSYASTEIKKAPPLDFSALKTLKELRIYNVETDSLTVNEDNEMLELVEINHSKIHTTEGINGLPSLLDLTVKKSHSPWPLLTKDMPNLRNLHLDTNSKAEQDYSIPVLKGLEKLKIVGHVGKLTINFSPEQNNLKEVVIRKFNNFYDESRTEPIGDGYDPGMFLSFYPLILNGSEDLAWTDFTISGVNLASEEKISPLISRGWEYNEDADDDTIVEVVNRKKKLPFTPHQYVVIHRSIIPYYRRQFLVEDFPQAGLDEDIPRELMWTGLIFTEDGGSESSAAASSVSSAAAAAKETS